MLQPSYHLESVIRTKDELEDFTGPLDVILTLLSKDKIAIRDIQISSLLEQYLSFLDRMKQMDLEIASEFIQMASYLMLIKTKMLLAEEKTVSEFESLVSMLEKLQDKEILNAVKEIIPTISDKYSEGIKSHTRSPGPLPNRPYSLNIDKSVLLEALASIIIPGETDTDDTPVFRGVPTPIVYGIKEKSEELKILFSDGRNLSLSELFSNCKSRSEIVATFISILELCADGLLVVNGEIISPVFVQGEDSI